MPTFSLECFQNEYLSPGAAQVGAVVSVRAESAPDEGPSTGIGASIPAAGAPRTELIIIDVSGSMSGKKITEAARAASAAVDCIEDGVQFALIAGNQTAWRLYPSAPGLKLAISSPETRREARKAVSGLRAGGGTAIGSWLGLATGLVADQEGIRHAILLTDGQNESEDDDALREALDAADGRFQCDCRGVGTDWSVEELSRIATALLGSVGLVRQPEELADDFATLMAQSMAREVGDVRLRLWTPAGASVAFVKVVSPELVDLTDRSVEVDQRSADYPTGAWSDESRDYHLSIRVPPASIGDEMLAGRVTLIVDGQPAGQALIRAVWTEDVVLSTRINRKVAHYTGQAELADLVHDGLEARRNGDADEATTKLGRAVQLAEESGNEVVAASLAKVVDVEDAATGKVRLKKKVDAADEMEAEIGSTKTARVR